jgi:hypothetical protein
MPCCLLACKWELRGREAVVGLMLLKIVGSVCWAEKSWLKVLFADLL